MPTNFLGKSCFRREKQLFALLLILLSMPPFKTQTSSCKFKTQITITRCWVMQETLCEVKGKLVKVSENWLPRTVTWKTEGH